MKKGHAASAAFFARRLYAANAACPGSSVLVAVVSLVFLISCQSKTRAAEDKPPTPVHAVPVKLFTPQSGERYSASLMPAEQLTLSFRIPGYVESIYNDGRGRRLEAGDLIPAGVTVAVLRPKDYDLQVTQAKDQLESARKNTEVARAAVAQAQAGLTRAEAAWKRADSLYESRALTAPDWEAARAQRDIAAAQLDSARSQLEAVTAQEGASAASLSTADLAKTDSVLIAPWTGRLLQRSVEVGSLVSPGQPAFVLAEINPLKAVFGVPDSAVAGLKKGDAIPVSVEAVPGEFHGLISSIAAAADPATRLFMIEATIANTGAALRPGMIATVNLRSSGAATQQVTVVPLSAIVRAKDEGAGFNVMVVRDNRARAQAVTLAGTYGDRIAVTGVQPGELVISSGASLIAEGERVEVIQ